MMKHCRWCEQTKPLDDFYPHPTMADGHLNKCKDCAKAYAQQKRLNDPLIQQRDRQRYREGRKPGRPNSLPRFVRRAHSALARAVRSGQLVRPGSCEQCGIQGVPIEGAHFDYSRPLEVRWLCRRCHRRWDTAEPKSLSA